VRGFGGARVEHHFQVAGDFDAAAICTEVAQAEGAQFAAAAGRHRDLEPRLDAAAGAADPGQAIIKAVCEHRVARRQRTHADRPELAAVEVAQVDEAAVRVLHRVALPAAEGAAGDLGVTGAGGSDQGGEAAVGQQAGACGGAGNHWSHGREAARAGIVSGYISMHST
jgi:hypothetical protein